MPRADIDFERELFEAANRMRGSIAPADYKHVVLPLIFLRYVSVRFDQRRSELIQMVRDPKSDWFTDDPQMQEVILADPDQYQAERVYILPPESHWSYLVQNAKQPNIKELIDQAMKKLEEANPSLAGVLPRIYQSSNLPSENLASLIEIFSRDIFFNPESSVDVLGRVYEYFIGNFANSEGSRGGEFFTPASIVKLLVAMLEPMEGTVFDPACGSGGMFIQSEMYTPNKHALSFYGQESIDQTIRLGKMNILLHGIDAEIRQGDSLLQDQYADQKFDFVISNPPFNQKLWGADRVSKQDSRLIGPVTDGNANYMWIQHFLHHVKSGGTAGFVMANGAMTTNTTGEKEVRQRLIEEGYVDCIVLMPDKLFFTTGIPCALFFLSKSRNGEKGFRVRKDEILFIDARKKGSMVSRKQKVFSDEEIQGIAGIYHAFKSVDSEYQDIAGLCKVAILEEVLKNDYKLTPGVYVGTEVGEVDDVPFEVKMEELTKRLEIQFSESVTLQSRILEQLRSLSHDHI